MGALLSYSLQASVLMILLFAAYKLFLSATTFHSFKRLTLLSILVASWLIPFALPEYERPAENSPEAATAAVSTACKGTIEIGVPIEIKDAGAGQDEVASVSSRPFWSAARIVYLTGILVVALYTLISMARLVWIIRNGTRQRVNGVNVLISTCNDGPFSWAGYVVVRPEDCDENLPLVIRHEMCHLRHGHWCDTLVAQANMILLWFNPVSYLIFSELKNIHEYEADSAIKPEQIRRYQLMLIKKAVGSGFPTLANSLNHSQIKIRITMMMKTKSCSARRFAALALPGAAVAGLFILSQPAVARVLDSVRNSDVSEEFVGKISQNQAEKQIADAVDMLMPGYVDAGEATWI